MRMTPTPGDVSSSGDITRVSDSVIHRSQAQQAAMGDTTYEAIAKVNALDEEQSRQISSLLEKVSIYTCPICHIALTYCTRLIVLR
jgi:hypothetical protein